MFKRAALAATVTASLVAPLRGAQPAAPVCIVFETAIESSRLGLLRFESFIASSSR
jgi:hypothetical protein